MKELEENIEKSVGEKCQEEDDYDEAGHSKTNLIEPDTKSDNMKDLKSLDFNSADDVRQRIKAVFTSKIPNFIEHTEDHIGRNNDCGDDLLKDNTRQGPALVIDRDSSKIKSDKNNKSLQTKGSTELPVFKIHDMHKRRGRPPKAGPSKKIQKQSVSTMYIGKLSNIVFSRRSSDSSDIDSSSS